MKWAKLKTDNARPTKDQLASFVYYSDQQTIDRTFNITRPSSERGAWPPDKKQEHLWVFYELPNYFGPEKQRDYEIFCGGFLQFYDIEVRNKATDHQLYFEWSPNKKGSRFYVAIYLYPKPAKEKDKQRLWEILPAAETKANASEGQKMVAELQAAAPAANSDTQTDMFASIDPPTPPPPPPPPRD